MSGRQNLCKGRSPDRLPGDEFYISFLPASPAFPIELVAKNGDLVLKLLDAISVRAFTVLDNFFYLESQRTRLLIVIDQRTVRAHVQGRILTLLAH